VIPQDKPPTTTVLVHSLTFALDEVDWGIRRVNAVWSRQQFEKECAQIRTMYKRKDKKVNPVNAPLPDGIKPEGEPLYENLNVHAGKTVPRGSRLTPERLAEMKIGEGLLWPSEREWFVNLLYEFEGVLAFEDAHMGLLDPAIEPPIQIHTVPHEPWQQQNLRLPKAMQDVATDIVKQKLDAGILEHSQGPYRGRYFVVAKKEPSSWRLINDV
jgi:hypothetical protein